MHVTDSQRYGMEPPTPSPRGGRMRVLLGSSQVLIAALFSMPGCHGQKEKALPERLLEKKVAESKPPLNKPAPEIMAQDTEGKIFRLSEQRGKVVLLSFWAHF